jgi:protein dithiol oxidoreductase (disulfide-forming)
MNFMRSLFAAIVLMVSTGITGLSGVHAEIVEGRDYTVLPQPRPTENGGNIEVFEFFWYGCPHCYDLHPHIKAWLKTKPGDVSFHYVPVIFRPSWIPGVRTFYALEALGVRGQLHDKVYEAIHARNIDLTREEVLFDWIARQGVDRQRFVEAYNSFAVQSQVSRATQIAQDYKLSGVPAIVVDGKYLTSGRMGGTPQDTIKIMMELIEKARNERRKER